MTSMKILQLSIPLTPLVYLRPKFFHHLDLGRPTLWKSPCPNDSQSIKGKHNPRMTFICYQVNPLIFSGFPLTSFNLAEVSLSVFSWLYTLMCAVAQKYTFYNCLSLRNREVTINFRLLQGINKTEF